ncbi:hypothetical protein Daus18300_013859 [Diaporthe australafricana]|uniref:Cytochrome P450 n=1 Tax=Diaporthe australafricana TaxID=127596 RepID=A0ABR3VXF3_9PEZI
MALPDLLGRLPDTTSSKAAFTAALGLVTYLLAVILYGILLHPLRKYPGPLYARFTRVPFWIASLRGDSHTFIHALHEKHGPVVRYSPSAVSYTEAQAWKDICGYEKGRRENSKSSWFQFPPSNGVPSIFALLDSDGHARVRRVFSPAFSERSLKQQQALFQRYVDLLVFKIGQQCQPGGDGRVEMVRMLNYMTFDIMAELCFGEPLGLLDKMEYSPWVASTFGAVRMLPFLQMCEYYPLLGYLVHKLEPKWARKMRDTHFRHSADRVDSRLADGSDKPDIWNLLLSEDGKQHRLTLDEMHSNSETFMMAATLMSGMLYYLLMNPNKYALLCAEIRTSFTSSDEITMERLAGLKYLNACIQEGLRMYPPVSVGVPRTIPTGGNAVMGQWLPAGTDVSVHQIAAYHSPANFKHPTRFVPERWLGDVEYKNDRRDVHQPFSFGPRNCIGMSFAWHEMRLAVGKLILNFDFELCDESRNWTRQKVFVLWEKNPLYVRVKPFVGERKNI